MKFGGGEIMVSTGDERIPAGWKLTVTNQYQKVCILFMISIVVLHVRHDVHTGSGESALFGIQSLLNL